MAAALFLLSTYSCINFLEIKVEAEIKHVQRHMRAKIFAEFKIKSLNCNGVCMGAPQLLQRRKILHKGKIPRMIWIGLASPAANIQVACGKISLAWDCCYRIWHHRVKLPKSSQTGGLERNASFCQTRIKGTLFARMICPNALSSVRHNRSAHDIPHAARENTGLVMHAYWSSVRSYHATCARSSRLPLWS